MNQILENVIKWRVGNSRQVEGFDSLNSSVTNVKCKNIDQRSVVDDLLLSIDANHISTEIIVEIARITSKEEVVQVFLKRNFFEQISSCYAANWLQNIVEGFQLQVGIARVRDGRNFNRKCTQDDVT